MFERFTDRARRALVHAQGEAVELGHGFIGTEHILLGLLHESEGVAAVVLADHGITLGPIRAQVVALLGVKDPAAALATIGIDLDEVRRSVEAEFGAGALQLPAPQPPFTPLAKRTLELALQQALQLNHYYIGTEHLILGVLSEPDGLAVHLVAECGVDTHVLRSIVTETIAPEVARVRSLEDRILRLAAAPGTKQVTTTARDAWMAARQRHTDAVRPLTAQLADEIEAALSEAEAALAGPGDSG